MRKFRYAVDIVDLSSDSQVWEVIAPSAGKMAIEDLRFDRHRKAEIGEEWKLLDTYDRRMMKQTVKDDLVDVLVGEHEKVALRGAHVTADGSVYLRVVERGMVGIGMADICATSLLVNSGSQPAFDVVIYDGDGKPIERYTIGTTAEETRVVEWHNNGLETGLWELGKEIKLTVEDPTYLYVVEHRLA